MARGTSYGRTVHCLKCGTLIEEGESPDPTNPKPCPNPECRSLERRVTFSAGTSITAVLGTATEVETALPIRVVKKQAATKTTTIDVATHSCEVLMTPPTDDRECWFVEVVRGGEIVDNGIGTDLVDALLDLIPRMLPPDHKEYRPENLDGE
jgi:hypothetical protein